MFPICYIGADGIIDKHWIPAFAGMTEASYSGERIITI
jgi:hypothetical protein